jgi:hypothetical protein
MVYSAYHEEKFIPFFILRDDGLHTSLYAATNAMGMIPAVSFGVSKQTFLLNPDNHSPIRVNNTIANGPPALLPSTNLDNKAKQRKEIRSPESIDLRQPRYWLPVFQQYGPL